LKHSHFVFCWGIISLRESNKQLAHSEGLGFLPWHEKKGSQHWQNYLEIVDRHWIRLTSANYGVCWTLLATNVMKGRRTSPHQRQKKWIFFGWKNKVLLPTIFQSMHKHCASASEVPEVEHGKGTWQRLSSSISAICSTDGPACFIGATNRHTQQNSSTTSWIKPKEKQLPNKIFCGCVGVGHKVDSGLPARRNTLNPKP
jgi:hypothetical protein